MSVSSVPGFDALGLSDNGQPSTTTASASSSSNAGGTTVPGFAALGINGDGSSSTAQGSPSSSTQSSSSTQNPSTSVGTENPYQQTFDQIQTWSDQYLMQAMEYGAPPIPQYTAGGSVDSFAQLTNTLAAIQPGVENGSYGGGTGTNVNTTA